MKHILPAIIILLLAAIVVFVLIFLVGFPIGVGVDIGINGGDEDADKKPVIYLYPEEACEVDVSLDYTGELTCTYPAYNNGWHVTASPDGTLTDADGNEYYCLFWEGNSDTQYDLSEGYCVAGGDTAAFLEEMLPMLGLNAKEANEFILFWLPQMQKNAYNLITFQADAYTDAAKLDITPAPDTLIRVFMVWQGLDAPITIDTPALPQTPTRDGFTVVEWGGREVGAN